MSYVYSNAAVFGSEAIAMCFTIYLGESIIANELLCRTKGRSMGWGMVALGFGLSFGVCIMMLGYISAHLNPASVLALLILGKIDGVGFVAAVCGEFLGAFVGACLVWLHFLPHFKTIPEPPAEEEDDILLRSRDALSPTALGIASYNAREEDIAARQRGFGGLGDALSDIRKYLRESLTANEPLERHAALVEAALGPDHFKGHRKMDVQEGINNHLRRHSVQVCDVHRRLKDIDLKHFQSMLHTPTGAVQGGGPDDPASTGGNQEGNGQTSLPKAYSEANLSDTLTTQIDENKFSHPSAPASLNGQPPAVQAKRRRLDLLYDAAVVADKNAKLSIFATRPAIYSPLFNFLCEFMCGTALVYGALMIYARREQLYGPERTLFRAEEGLIIGFFVFVCILGLGGPTGIAANPARDFSPRLAHWILPIPGKGPSEFYYSWIPFFAPLVGGCAAAGLYAATQLLNHSDVPGTVSWSGSGP